MSVFHTNGVETNPPSTPSALQRLPGALMKLWRQREVLEDFHAAEHLQAAFATVYGENSSSTQAQSANYRTSC